METEHLLGIAEVATARLALGAVAEADVDGTLVVVLEATGEAFRAHVLHTGHDSAGVVLVPRDRVLVWHSGRQDDWGVVVGRIGQSHAPPQTSVVDREPPELVIEATHNLTLKCGDGSITIRDDGRILIKGKDLVSHAQRVNRIRGGSVEIN